MKGNNLYNNVVSILVSPLTLIISFLSYCTNNSIFILKSFLINLNIPNRKFTMSYERTNKSAVSFYSALTPNVFNITIQYLLWLSYKLLCYCFTKQKEYKMSTWKFPITSKRRYCNWLYNYL